MAFLPPGFDAGVCTGVLLIPCFGCGPCGMMILHFFSFWAATTATALQDEFIGRNSSRLDDSARAFYHMHVSNRCDATVQHSTVLTRVGGWPTLFFFCRSRCDGCKYFWGRRPMRCAAATQTGIFVGGNEEEGELGLVEGGGVTHLLYAFRPLGAFPRGDGARVFGCWCAGERDEPF